MSSSLTRATASGDTDAWWETLSPLKADAVTPRRLPISPPILPQDFAYSPFHSNLFRGLSGSPGSPEHFSSSGVSALPASCSCCCYLS